MSETEIPASKILDAFIIENESPYIIIEFLRSHENEFSEMSKQSLCFNRIFQLDFFLRCNQSECEYLMSKLQDIPIDTAALFTWQVLRSKSDKAYSVQYKFRHELEWILKHGPRHPYAFGHERYVSIFDSLFFELARRKTDFHTFTQIKDEDQFSFFKNIEYSLFRDRVLQIDFFNELSDATKCAMLLELKKLSAVKNTFEKPLWTISLKNFLFQLLEYNTEDWVRQATLDIFDSAAHYLITLDKETISLIHTCDSFSEFKLKSTISCIECSKSLMIYMLCNKQSWLKEWVKYDQDEVDNILKISDLLSQRAKTRKHRK